MCIWALRCFEAYKYKLKFIHVSKYRDQPKNLTGLNSGRPNLVGPYFSDAHNGDNGFQLPN